MFINLKTKTTESGKPKIMKNWNKLENNTTSSMSQNYFNERNDLPLLIN